MSGEAKTMSNPDVTEKLAIGNTSAPCPGSAFIVKTAMAYHRAEQDAFANLAQALKVCPASEWPWASKRCGRKQNNLAGRLWTWALCRWGKRWLDTEYATRERTPNAGTHRPTT